MSEKITVTVNIEHALKTNAELVFAYEMRDQVAVRGQLAVQKEFPTWFQNFVADVLEQKADAINKRIEQKKWNMVVELQKKFKYTLEEATKQVFGVPLVQAPANVVKAA